MADLKNLVILVSTFRLWESKAHSQIGAVVLEDNVGAFRTQK